MPPTAQAAPAIESGRAGIGIRRVRDRLELAGWLAPAYVLMFAVTAYPLAANLISSFLDEAPLGQPQAFVGLKNYQKVLGSPAFFSAFVHSPWY